MSYNTVTREFLEAELDRCNAIMVKDGKRIGEMRALLTTIRSDMLDYAENCDDREDLAHYCNRIDQINHILK